MSTTSTLSIPTLIALCLTPLVTELTLGQSTEKILERSNQPELITTKSLHSKLPHLWPSSISLELTQPEIHQSDGPPHTPLLVVIGDSRAAIDKIGPSAHWFSQATMTRLLKPRALLHLGDWVKRGHSQREWGAVTRSLSLLGDTPLITTRGNHDRGGLYEALGFTAHPSHPLELSQVGPLLIITLDSEVETRIARAAVERLYAQSQRPEWRATLEARGVKGLIWAQHRPLWSSGNHGSDERGWATWLVPILESLRVTLMLAGHDHDYERFCESRGVGVARRCVDLAQTREGESAQRGVHYIVSGGGASVTVPFPNLAWRKRPHERQVNDQQRILFSAEPHILELSVTPTSMTSTTSMTRDQQNNKSGNSGLKITLSAWATPHEGTRWLIDQAVIPINPLY